MTKTSPLVTTDHDSDSAEHLRSSESLGDVVSFLHRVLANELLANLEVSCTVPPEDGTAREIRVSIAIFRRDNILGL